MRPSRPSSGSSRRSPGGSPVPDSTISHQEYELVFQALGTVNEVGGQSLRLSGKVRVIQGPKQLNVKTLDDATPVYAFLSVNDVNLPLLPSQLARRVAPQ
eukprot:IDg9193t1